jgi:hypothetical protein
MPARWIKGPITLKFVHTKNCLFETCATAYQPCPWEMLHLSIDWFFTFWVVIHSSEKNTVKNSSVYYDHCYIMIKA